MKAASVPDPKTPVHRSDLTREIAVALIKMLAGTIEVGGVMVTA